MGTRPQCPATPPGKSLVGDSSLSIREGKWPPMATQQLRTELGPRIESECLVAICRWPRPSAGRSRGARLRLAATRTSQHATPHNHLLPRPPGMRTNPQFHLHVNTHTGRHTCTQPHEGSDRCVYTHTHTRAHDMDAPHSTSCSTPGPHREVKRWVPALRAAPEKGNGGGCIRAHSGDKPVTWHVCSAWTEPRPQRFNLIFAEPETCLLDFDLAVSFRSPFHPVYQTPTHSVAPSPSNPYETRPLLVNRSICTFRGLAFSHQEGPSWVFCVEQ